MGHRPASPLHQWGSLAPCHWRQWLAVAALLSLQWLPTRLRLAFGSWWGRRRFRRDHAARARVERLLHQCLRRSTAEERAFIVRRHFEQQAHCLFDRGLLWWGNPSRWNACLKIEGEEHLQPLLESGRPVVFFSGEHVAQDFARLALHRRYYMALSVMDQQGSENPVERLMARGRLRSGGVFLQKNDEMQILRMVRDGYLLVQRPEGLPVQVPAPFFSARAATGILVARMARLCNAVVVPYMAYHRNGRYLVRLYPAVEVGPAREERLNAARLNAALERMIARAPEQFLWESIRLLPGAVTISRERPRLAGGSGTVCSSTGIAPAQGARTAPLPRSARLPRVPDRGHRCPSVPPAGGDGNRDPGAGVPRR